MDNIHTTAKVIITNAHIDRLLTGHQPFACVSSCVPLNGPVYWGPLSPF